MGGEFIQRGSTRQGMTHAGQRVLSLTMLLRMSRNLKRMNYLCLEFPTYYFYYVWPVIGKTTEGE